MHFMDLHDSRSASRFFHLLSRYRYFLDGLLKEFQVEQSSVLHTLHL